VDGYFWVLGLNPKALYQIDPETREIVTTITIPLVKEGWYAFDEGTLWYTDIGAPGRVIGIDMHAQLTVHDFRLNEDPADLSQAVGVTIGAGSLWVSKPDAGEIVRLDPQTGDVQARIESFVPDILEFGDGALWVVGAGRIARVDPATNRLSFEARELALNANLSEIEFGDGHAWTADDVQGLVGKIDSTGSVVGTYQAGAGASSLAYADGVIWVGNQDAATVTGINTTTGVVTTHETGHALSTVAANDGELLVGVWPRVDDYLATMEGDVLKVALADDPFFPAPDPPVNQSFEFRQVGHATCAGLLTYPDEPAPDGWELRPEVAEAFPEVSDDGRTYTYTIRDGFAFSPPSDQPITAETYRYSIERALSAGLGGSSQFIGMRFLGDIVGAQAFHDGEAEHVEGIVADGNRLSVTLEAPSGDLPARLALPYFCPVPIGTPVVFDGLDTRPPLSAAGPYYVHQHFGGELLELRPNPNYEGSRPQSWDHIVFRLGIGLADAVALVEAGEMDAVLGPSNRSPLRPLGDLANEWGPGSEAAVGGDQRWYGAPRFGLDFIAIAELFSDPAVRQAVSLALDREALAVAYAEAPAVGLLPPSVPGSPPMDAAIPEQDVEAALELMNGRTGSAVMVAWGACSVCVEFANTVAGQLAAIGIEVEVREVDDPVAALHEDDEASLANGFLDTDFPDPGALLENIRLLPWTPTEILEELDRVQSSGGDERVAAAAALANRLSDEDFLAIPAVYPVYPMYIAEDVGCAFVQPAIGAVDLVQLCRD
jgi:ABC-type transport system substrate-binding protein